MNKKSATALLSGCVLIGGFAGLASAQDNSGSYGSEPAVEVVEETVEETVETSAPSTSEIVTVQDTDEEDTGTTDGTETEADAEADVTEREGAEGCERGEHHRRGGRGLRGVAEAIGIDNDELRAAVEAGQTVAEVSEANGVDVDTLVDTLTADIEEHLDAEVEAGEITADEAAEKLAEKTERLEDKINGVDSSEEAA